MSLINKIFAAFACMMAIAIIAGFIGWRSVSRINVTMNDIVDYELAAETNFNALESTFQAITVAQRTLLNVYLPMETRVEQAQIITDQSREQQNRINALTTIINEGASRVHNWDVVLKEWNAIQPELKSWEQAVGDGRAKVAAWEKTTILNPDALLRDIMQYRGDHFQLATRLGEMIADEKAIGAEIGAADNLCAFGRWRTRFDNGEELFSANANLRKAMDIMTGPHREFHRTAAETYKLIAAGFEENSDEIAAMYKQHLQAARQVIDTFAMISEEVDTARKLYTEAENFTMGELRERRSSALAAVHNIIDTNKQITDANIADAITDGRSSVLVMEILAGAALVLGLAIIVILYLTIRRQLTLPLTRVIAALAADANQVAYEANGVASSSAALSEGSSSQSAALEQTSAAIEEITSMARKNLDNAKTANEQMRTNAEQVSQSTEAVNRMGTAMDEIKDSSEKIGNILKTIEEIAFQTNLLALNAAVEAARAGEAGKGFAVVADEVRNLAQRSAQAVKDTSELITGTVDRVNNGVHITDEIEQYFSRIAGTTDGIVRMIEEIDVATSEQTQGLEQINQSVAQIDQVNQQNARHAEDNATASVTLNERSGNLMEMIGDLGDVLGKIIGKNQAALSHNAAGATSEPKMVNARLSMKALPAPDEQY